MTRAKKNSNPADFVGRPVWAEVSLSALAGNLHAIRDYVNPASEKRKTPRKVLSIVKGNAYGHGGPAIAKALEKAGSDWFGVASAGEGIEIRKAGVRKPILVLGGFWPGEEKICSSTTSLPRFTVANNFSPTKPPPQSIAKRTFLFS